MLVETTANVRHKSQFKEELGGDGEEWWGWDGSKIEVPKIYLATALPWVHLGGFQITKNVCFVLYFLSETPQSNEEGIDFTDHASQFESHCRLNSKLVEWLEDGETWV